MYTGKRQKHPYLSRRAVETDKWWERRDPVRSHQTCGQVCFDVSGCEISSDADKTFVHMQKQNIGLSYCGKNWRHREGFCGESAVFTAARWSHASRLSLKWLLFEHRCKSDGPNQNVFSAIAFKNKQKTSHMSVHWCGNSFVRDDMHGNSSCHDDKISLCRRLADWLIKSDSHQSFLIRRFYGWASVKNYCRD